MENKNPSVVQKLQAAKELELSARQVRQLEEQAAQLLAAANRQSETKLETKPVPQPGQRKLSDDPAIEQKQLEIARLEAQIAKEIGAWLEAPSIGPGG